MQHSVSKYRHICNDNCTNYPLQRCSNVCGIVSSVCAVIGALNITKFEELTSPCFATGTYLQDPTKYEKFLRRVIISWFMQEKVSLDLLFPKEVGIRNADPVVVSHDHNYAKIVRSEPNVQAKSLSPENFNSYSNCAMVEDFSQESISLSKQQGVKKPASETVSSFRKDSNDKKKNEKIKYECPFCSMVLGSRQALLKHKKRKHAFSFSRNSLSTCVECEEFFCTSISDLILHLNKKHNKDIKVLSKLFMTNDEFKLWKKEIERETKSSFVKKTGAKTSSHCSTNFYYCRRSGKKDLVPEPKRCSKMQGSCKLGYYCTAFMTVKTNSKTGSVSVEYCLDHTGHAFHIAHQSFSENLRLRIAGQLSQGIEPGKILDQIRDEVGEIDRDALITRQDIYNIKNQFSISDSQKHKEDGLSVELWVKELRRDSGDPIIFYKPQGVSHSSLKDEDFLLCIQTDYQKTMFSKHAQKMICCDSTHETTQYNFYLTTVLVLDELNEGVPVAWAISNREDATIMGVFYKAIKDSLGEDILVSYFMSDMANNFYNAWCSIFSQPLNRLWCSWHVDRAWRKKIFELIKSKSLQCDTYAYLKLLQVQTDDVGFEKRLNEFLKFLSSNCESFLDYFLRYYVNDNKVCLWAACFRVGASANTNMFAEAFHRVLKEVYFNRKQNKRVDFLLVVLLKFARDKAYEHLIKLTKGKVTHRLKEMRKRHSASLSVDTLNIQIIDNNQWYVPSSSKDKEFYTVSFLLDNCQCKLVCCMCKVCVHMYRCTCADYLLKTIACKHIHAVHSAKSSIMNVEYTNEEVEDLSFIETVLKKDRPVSCTNMTQMKQNFLSSLSKIMNLVISSEKLNTAQRVTKGVNDLYALAKLACGLESNDTKTGFEKKLHVSRNKNHETQRRIFSTKKKSRKRGSKLQLRKIDISIENLQDL